MITIAMYIRETLFLKVFSHFFCFFNFILQDYFQVLTTSLSGATKSERKRDYY